jgi:hypothetical protein
VVLAELSGGIAEIAEKLRNRRVLEVQAKLGAGHADFC